jgi:hypothetical protein
MAPGFTVVDLIAVIAIVIVGTVLVLLVLRYLGQPRGAGSRMMGNNSQLRGIHQGFVVYAQSNKQAGQDGYFPGLDSSGAVVPDGPDTGHSGDGTHPGARMWMLLEGNYFTADYMINPADPHAVEAEIDPATGQFEPITAEHFSYALLMLESTGDTETGQELADEWKETLNTSAIAIGDRGIGTNQADLSSVWTTSGSGDWRGGVTRNDNSTSFETHPEFASTKYGNAPAIPLDHLFEDDDPAHPDTVLVHDDATTAYSAK